MTITKCRKQTDVSKIKFEERGRKAIFVNPDRRSHFRTKIDGCLISDGLAADWILTRTDVGDVIIELKGTDVNHAAAQIMHTAAMWHGKLCCRKTLAGLIVCRQYPRIDTTIQKAKLRFKKKHGGPLHVVAKNREYVLESVLRFDGP